MARFFTAGKIDANLEACHACSVSEFGEDYCISLDRIRRYRQAGVHFYQPYGDPTINPGQQEDWTMTDKKHKIGFYRYDKKHV